MSEKTTMQEIPQPVDSSPQPFGSALDIFLAETRSRTKSLLLYPVQILDIQDLRAWKTVVFHASK